ncbi:MAG: RNA polymerase sigma factor RpoD/SigA [Acidimicrobiales bacterium]|nr:RNA polymerase sigma factor RpoD/SigA [Acidimicrobiales bacterium]
MKNDKRLLTQAEERSHGLQIQKAAIASKEILEVFNQAVSENPRSSKFVHIQETIASSKNFEFNFLKILEMGETILSEDVKLTSVQSEILRENLKIVTYGKASKEEMINRNQGLVRKLASTHINQIVPLDDLTQAGNIGLIRAVEKFDPLLGNKFSTYARNWIKQTINRYVDEQHTIKVPEYLRNKIARIKKVQNEILQATGEEASLAQIADEAEMTEAEVEQLLSIKQDAVSLNKAIGEGDSELEDLIQDKQGPSPEEEADKAMVKDSLRRALNELSEAEREVIVQRFSLDGGKKATLEEIGSSQGISKEAVRLKLQRIIRKLASSQVLKNLNETDD